MKIFFHPDDCRMGDIIPYNEDGGKMFPYEVEQERPFQ